MFYQLCVLIWTLHQCHARGNGFRPMQPMQPLRPMQPMRGFGRMPSGFMEPIKLDPFPNLFDDNFNNQMMYPKFETFRFQRSIHSSYFLMVRKQAVPKDMDVLLECPSDKYTLDSNGVCTQRIKIDSSKQKCPNGFSTVKDNDVCIKTVTPECVGTKIGQMCRTKGCANGYEKENSLCYSVCPSGYKKYFSNFCVTNDATCPRDYFVKDDRCFLSVCPKGMIKTDTHCENPCPEGSSKVGSQCISKEINKCPPNYSIQKQTCVIKKCEDDEIMLREKGCVNKDFMKCPLGYENFGTVCRSCADETDSRCKEWSIMCPDGWYKISNNECVQVCPSGTAAYNDECISLRAKGCPEGFLHFQDKGCIRIKDCPEGYNRVVDECVKLEMTCSAFTLDGKCVDSCPDGHVPFEDRCIKMSSGKCPESFGEIEKQYCVDACPNDHVLVGGKCILKTPCSDSQNYLFGKCVPKCPSGYEIDKSEGICSVIKMQCGKDEYYSNGECLTVKQCINKDMIVDDVFSTCQSSTVCSLDQVVFGSHCLSSCPLGFNRLLRSCRSKPEKAKCETGLIFQGECIPRCPDGYEPQYGTCVKVPEQKALSPACGENMFLKTCEKDGPTCSPKCICRLNYVAVVGSNVSKCVEQLESCATQHPVDVVYIIDSSNLMQPEDFEKMRLFLLETVTHLFATKNPIQVAVVLFGPKEPQLIYLHILQEECELISFLSSMTHLGGNQTNIVNGISVARELILSQCNGARVGAVRQVFVFSTAKQFTPQVKEALNEEINDGRLLGHRISFFTIGNATNLPDDVYNFNVDKVASLQSQSTRVATIVCKEFACPKGYQKVKNACVDVNECTKSLCHTTSRCINTPGSFFCVCPTNTTYVDHTQGCKPISPSNKDCITIKPVDVCSLVTCQGDANCSSYNGNAFCVCKPGFSYDEKLGCVDVDECKLKACLDNANCTNTIGSFYCGCNKGYTYNKHFGCVDVDECATQKNLCAADAKCQNLEGSYTCTCNKGYNYHPVRGCEDIDECTTGKPCSGLNVVCVNTNGSFACVCSEGYEYGGSGCVDIDECKILGNNACGNGSTCVNTQPGYNCSCSTGYIYNKDKKNCQVDQTSGVQQKKVDLMFVVDSGKAMTSTIFIPVKSMVQNMIEDYKSKSQAIVKRNTIIQMGHPTSSVQTLVISQDDEKAIDSVKKMEILGGTTSVLNGLKKIRELYQNNGQANATRLIFLITSTSLEEEKATNSQLKELMNQIRAEKDTHLIVLLLGSQGSLKEWTQVLTLDDINKMVYVVDENQISNVHRLVFQKSDHMLSCPDGFVVLNDLCQYKGANVQTCRMDNNEYLLNSTWTKECVKYQCTAAGVTMLSIQCMGYDGDCYDESQEFPCNKDGEYHAYCKCSIQKVGVLQSQNYSSTGLSIQYRSIKSWTIADAGNVNTGNCTCQFPFKFRTNWYYTCTRADSSYLWCGMDTNYQNRRYCSCYEPPRDCLLADGTRKQHGSRWTNDCNELFCDKGSVSITTRCRDKDNICIPTDTIFSCSFDNRVYNNCICLADSYGFGVTKIMGSSHTSVVGKVETRVSSLCVNLITNKNYTVNETWTEGCFQLQCVEGGKTEVKRKGCHGSNSTCYDVGSKGFPCIISQQTYTNCTCIESGMGVQLSSFSQGVSVSETKEGVKNTYTGKGKEVENILKGLNVDV